MEQRVFEAALAGLLHDIGKVVQRSRAEPWKRPEGIDADGQPVHANWSTYFIQHNVPKEYQQAALPAAFHHWPEKSPGVDKSLSKLVALADKLSSGEREDYPDEEKGQKTYQQMITIFDRLTLMGERKKKDYKYLPLSALELRENVIFPGEAMDPRAVQDAYDKLREVLEKAAKQDIADPETYLEHLLSAFQQAAWCVPSAYYHSIPDVSLYDHSRMTAALAVCLSGFDEDQVDGLLGAVSRAFWEKPKDGDTELLEQPVALLAGGDISGIQDFIYTLSSKGAAKTLRGRSFYLQLLTEAVLRYVLRELGLPYSNVIYSGGGHFYFLAPLSAVEKMTELRAKITETLLHFHGTDLYLALEYAEVPADGFKKGSFPDYWDRMHANIKRAKLQRYTELEDRVYPLVFKPVEHGGNREKTCAVCGRESLHVSDLEGEEQDDKICTLCKSFEKQIGAELPQADFIVLSFGDPLPMEEQQPASAFDILGAFGMGVDFRSAKSKAKKRAGTLVDTQRAVIWALDDPHEWPVLEGVPAAHSLHYTVKHIPREKGVVLSFDELQNKAAGISRLGVLRLDVDDLGQMFTKGFGENATLARLSTLSFQLSLFFEGWIKRLCDKASEKNLIYAVYAGGDDVFLIAPWDLMPALAVSIIDDFSKYTSYNPDLHISGGMAFIHGKYPVYQAAEDAGDAEKKAKDVDGKDAFTFLDTPWKWGDFRQVIEKYKKIVHIVQPIDKDGLNGPKALLQVLQNLAAQEAAKANRLDGRPVWGPWMWRGDYQLTRMAERAGKKEKELEGEIQAILDDLRGTENSILYQDINQWGAAARWAQLFTRKKSKKDDDDK